MGFGANTSCASSTNINNVILTTEASLSFNVSIRNTMAPALTEPLSQTNKLSSSATSASPRPTSSSPPRPTSSSPPRPTSSSPPRPTSSSPPRPTSSSPRPTSNNLSSSNNDISNANHNNTINVNSSSVSNIIDSSRNSSSTFIGNTILNKDSSYINNKKGEFQLAFVQFQQTAAANRQLKRNNNSLNNQKTKIVKSTDSLSASLQAAASSVNGRRLSDEQMGPMCDTNSSIVNFNDSNPESKQQLEDVEDYIHMDYTNCDTASETSQDNPSIENNADKNQEQRDEQQQKCTEEVEIQETEEHLTDDGQEEEESNKQISCDSGDNQAALQVSESINQKSPPRTPTTASTNPILQSHTQITPSSSLTPQSTTSGMGLQKDFIKDSAEMDQVLGELSTSDMDLLQVLKGFDTTPGGVGSFCELSLFTDVDVMNYEEVGIQQPKDCETKEIRTEIEKRQQKIQRKCDFLLRRLRKIEARYMGKHTSEEITGLFEWGANPTLRRKDHDPTRLASSYEDDKRRQISTATMKAFVRRIDSAATTQHSSLVKRNKVGRPSNASLQLEMSGGTQHKGASVASVVPGFNEKMAEEIANVSGFLHTELKEVQYVLDSEVTASSSGGESADEMQHFNNTMQQPLSISKRAGWRWARDRASIASRWTWLLAQISDLEYRIRQHNELHHQIKKNKGAVTFEKNSSTTSSTTNPTNSPIQPSSVNGFRGVLPGNSKSLDAADTITTSPLIPPNGAYDSSASNLAGSCRTRPFQRTGFRKRKLLQTANVHTVSKKAAKPSTVKCGCQWPLHPCALCTGRADPTAPRDLPDTMTSSERVALLDPGFHPVLSFPEDVSHNIHFEATMRLPEWQNRVIRCSTKSALKGAIAVQKAAEREERSKKYVDSRRKYSRKYTQDIMAANKLKNAKSRRTNHDGQYNNIHHTKNKHRKLVSSKSGQTGSAGFVASAASGTVAAITLNSKSGGLTTGGLSSTSSTAGSDSMGLLLNDTLDTTNGLFPRSKNASPTPGCFSSSSYKNERMDRRNRNSYDIDNIVIPYSVAAATRVELLPYKEIPTPKWRVIDDNVEDEFKSKKNEILDSIVGVVAEKTDDELLNAEKTTDESLSARLQELTEEDEVEDISDEAIQMRHDRALMEERKKFQTYLKFPWSTRSRANRRIDSRAESSGANTPDPTSPAPNTPSVGGDQESIPSPAAPSTPQTPLDSTDGVEANVSANQSTIATPSNPATLNSLSSAARRAERKRTVSARKEREHSKDETGRSVTPDLRETIPPYDPLEFPLSDDLYDAMLKMMPNDHHLLEECLKTDICDGTEDKDNRGGGIGGTAIDGQELNTTKTNAIVSLLHNKSIVGGGDKHNVFTTNMIHAFETGDNLIGGDSDTDSAESGLPDEDPNDPEWREPE